jgi:transposase
MAKYKPYNYDQMVMLPLRGRRPINLKEQLEPGTLEYAIHELVEKKIDTSLRYRRSIFEERFQKDETGAPAFSPKILLKIILFAYSRGMTGSRPIERACHENVLFMALGCGYQPDHSTIAHFVSSMKDEIESIFCNILLVCEGLNLRGGTHFSLDGLKLPSNASKEWSGTFKELKRKRYRLQQKLHVLPTEHIRMDMLSESDNRRREKQKKRLERQVQRLDKFLKENTPKPGKTKAEIQSNVTDNELAKMPTSHGVIQGYNAQAIVDDKHQIIIHAEAFGKGEDCLENKQLSADSSTSRVVDNYHNKENLSICEEEKIDAYIPDPLFRKRDVRFAEQDRFKDGINPRKPIKKSNRNPNTFTEDCAACPLRLQCLRTSYTQSRYLSIPVDPPSGEKRKAGLLQQMKAKIDTPEGRKIYSKRLAIIEPVFANIRTRKRLDRFTLRTKTKVNVQWMLFALVHNIEKIVNYGMAY